MLEFVIFVSCRQPKYYMSVLYIYEYRLTFGHSHQWRFKIYISSNIPQYLYACMTVYDLQTSGFILFADFSDFPIVAVFTCSYPQKYVASQHPAWAIVFRRSNGALTVFQMPFWQNSFQMHKKKTMARESVIYVPVIGKRHNLLYWMYLKQSKLSCAKQYQFMSKIFMLHLNKSIRSFFQRKCPTFFNINLLRNLIWA